MKLSPFNANDQDFNSSPMKKWFSSIYAALTNIETTNHIVVDNSDSGVVLKDTAGHYWKLKVSTAGVVSTEDLGTNKP
jgi:hypothetical protein